MAKKDKLDELYGDENTSNVLKTTSFTKSKEEPVKNTPTVKEQIEGLLVSAIHLLNRNIRNKERAIENIHKGVELLKKL